MIDVCNIQVMRPLLAEHGFHFSKAKGQNFLIARWVPEQIAERSGYRNESVFYQKFKKITGITPSQWRKEHAH